MVGTLQAQTIVAKLRGVMRCLNMCLTFWLFLFVVVVVVDIVVVVVGFVCRLDNSHLLAMRLPSLFRTISRLSFMVGQRNLQDLSQLWVHCHLRMSCFSSITLGHNSYSRKVLRRYAISTLCAQPSGYWYVACVRKSK